VHDGGDLSCNDNSRSSGAAGRAGNGFRRGTEVKEAT
jgi:hypothetical protein